MSAAPTLIEAVAAAEDAVALVGFVEGDAPAMVSASLTLRTAAETLRTAVGSECSNESMVEPSQKLEMAKAVTEKMVQAVLKLAMLIKAVRAPHVKLRSAAASVVQLASQLGLDTSALESMQTAVFLERLGRRMTREGSALNKLTQGNDILQLSLLEETPVLANLEERFLREVVYTNVGDIVVTVNPFTHTGSATPEVRQLYIDIANGVSRRALPPHAFTLAARAYQQMIQAHSGEGHFSKVQSILVSGESGAGKTETAKVVVAYLCDVGGGDDERVSSAAKATARRMIDANLVFESLGNAATVRNANSSRFGKHFELQLSREGKLVGAFSSVYLLEKPRVCSHPKGETNYHIFYLLCNAPASLRSTLGIGPLESYRFIQHDGTADRQSWQDAAYFASLHASLPELGFSRDEVTFLYSMLAAVLRLGNLNFEPINDGNGSKVANQDELKGIASLLGVTAAELEAAVCVRTIIVVKDKVGKTLPPDMAMTARNALAMRVYSLVFEWTVATLNRKMASPKSDGSIGILDIFGFENFASRNGFSQLCINLTNESLQQLFIERVFKLERLEYEAEGLQWKEIAYADNQPVLDLITKRPACIFGSLDDATNAGNTDQQMVTTMHRSFAKVAAYVVPSVAPDFCFGVRHYAGEVVYTADGFVDANKDELSTDLAELILDKTNTALLKQIVTAAVEREAAAVETKPGAPKKKRSICREFSNALATLMKKLRASDPHYIRCLKPNQKLLPGVWDASFMSKQLAYSGLLEFAQVRKATFAERRVLVGFFAYFSVCSAEREALKDLPVDQAVGKLLQELKVPPEGYRVGLTKVFMTPAAIKVCTDARQAIKDSAAEKLRILSLIIVLRRYLRRHVTSIRARQEAERATRAAAALEEMRTLEGRAAALGRVTLHRNNANFYELFEQIQGTDAHTAVGLTFRGNNVDTIDTAHPATKFLSLRAGDRIITVDGKLLMPDERFRKILTTTPTFYRLGILRKPDEPSPSPPPPPASAKEIAEMTEYLKKRVAALNHLVIQREQGEELALLLLEIRAKRNESNIIGLDINDNIVKSILPGTPAAARGNFLPGDRIIACDDTALGPKQQVLKLMKPDQHSYHIRIVRSLNQDAEQTSRQTMARSASIKVLPGTERDTEMPTVTETV